MGEIHLKSALVRNRHAQDRVCAGAALHAHVMWSFLSSARVTSYNHRAFCKLPLPQLCPRMISVELLYRTRFSFCMITSCLHFAIHSCARLRNRFRRTPSTDEWEWGKMCLRCYILFWFRNTPQMISGQGNHCWDLRFQIYRWKSSIRHEPCNVCWLLSCGHDLGDACYVIILRLHICITLVGRNW